MATFNSESFRRKAGDFAQSKKVRDRMYERAVESFEQAKSEMLDDYDNDPVVQELMEGPENESSGIISQGNIFAFLGFERGDGPANELKQYLKTNITMNKTPVVTSSKTRVNYQYKIKIPSERQFYSAFPATWSTKSWIDYIENGLGNAGLFIFNAQGFGDYSRSGTGLQLKKGERGTPPTFTPIKFLSEILENFIERFK